jgi:hypothetical protein
MGRAGKKGEMAEREDGDGGIYGDWAGPLYVIGLESSEEMFTMLISLA